MKTPNYLGAEKYAFLELKLLPKRLYFHNIRHTKEVLEAVGRLTSLENLTPQKCALLRTAAAYHDTGYVSNYKNHEKAGVKLARNILPSYNYKSEYIEQICGMIMATKMPQNPRTKLQEILCDADLDNLGREDFFIKGELLRLELLKHGVNISPRRWYEQNIKFLENHNYHTDSAKKLRQKKKEQNIREMKELLGINNNL